jgi:hypothetical protein
VYNIQQKLFFSGHHTVVFADFFHFFNFYICSYFLFLYFLFVFMNVEVDPFNTVELLLELT